MFEVLSIKMTIGMWFLLLNTDAYIKIMSFPINIAQTQIKVTGN